MKKLILLAALAGLAGCNPESMAEVANRDGSRPVDPATYRTAVKLCKERYEGLYRTESNLYGPYGDYAELIDDAKACMYRHGVKVLGFRQKDGRLTAYPHSPKYLEY